MKILVNSKETEVSFDSSVAHLSLSLQLSDKGVAIAVNNKMISRSKWDTFILKENDNVIIIKAACGG